MEIADAIGGFKGSDGIGPGLRGYSVKVAMIFRQRQIPGVSQEEFFCLPSAHQLRFNEQAAAWVVA